MIRQLLLAIEALDLPPGCSGHFYAGEGGIQVEGYADDAVAHHLTMLIDSGFVVGDCYQSGGFAIERLTWQGCEFLDDVRDPEIWRKTKDRLKSVGSAGVGLFWELAKAEVKTKLGLH